MKILGIDYGDSRTGVAISDESEFLSSGVCVIFERDIDKVASKICEIAKENNSKKIVLGLPKNMDGTLGFRAQKTTLLKEKLEKLLDDTKIIFFDERLSTVEASYYMNQTNTRGKKRKNSIDELAAKIILQSYLDSKKHDF